MNIKDQIKYLITGYKNGEYDTQTFSDQFCVLYNYEISGRTFFSQEERLYLDELAYILEMYSPYEEDLYNHPDTYFNEIAVKEKADEIFNRI